MREVLLRLRTAHYERARDLAQAVRERAERVLTTARQVGGELRQSVDKAKELGAVRERAAALGKRGAGAAGRDMEAFDQGELRGGLGRVGRVRARAESLLGGLSRDSLPALMAGLGPLVPGGALLAFLAPFAERVFRELERKLEAQLAAREAAFLARLEEERLRTDYARRLAEDPGFARAEARRAFEEALLEEASLGRRIERTTAELVSDLGL